MINSKQAIRRHQRVVAKEIGVKSLSLDSHTRVMIYSRDHNACIYCGNEAESIDHIIPRSVGGTNYIFNLASSCLKCNYKKRANITGNLIRKGWAYIQSLYSDIPELGKLLFSPRPEAEVASEVIRPSMYYVVLCHLCKKNMDLIVESPLGAPLYCFRCSNILLRVNNG